MSAIEQELFEQIRRLDNEQKKQVLDFVQRLTQPKGETFRDIFQHAREIAFPKEDLDEEQIDWDD